MTTRKRVTAKKSGTKSANSIALDAAVAMDSFSNMAARMGAGTPSLAEATEYTLERWTNNYWLMLTLFRNHWISRRIVETPARDMCRAWPTINSDLKADDVKKFERTLRRTMVQQRIQKSIVWGNLFGGAGALMVLEGQENMLEEPLELDEIGPGDFKGLIVFDRWSGISPVGNASNDISKPIDFGHPEYYSVHSNGNEIFRIHSSRILRFAGPDVPSPEYEASMYWGISKLEVCYEELRKRDNMSWSILQLLFRAQILAQKNPELAQMLSGASGGGAAAQKQFFQTLQAQNELLSNQSMLILGEDGELQSHQYTFGGVGDVYAQFQMDVAGAAGIPVTKLFGRTITGLGQSNDADMRIYEQEIAMDQNDRLRPQLDKLYPVIFMSEFGEIPDDYDLDFPSARVLTEEEKVALTKDGTAAISLAYQDGAITHRDYLKELKKLSVITGVFASLTEEKINSAPDDFVQPLELQEKEVAADKSDKDGAE